MFGGGNRQKDVIEVPKLEPKDLYDRRKRRDFARLRSYNTLLQQIYHRVYSASQLPINTCSVLYTIPPFIIGLPKIDMEDCVVYLVFQLRQAGFEVKYTHPNLLYISWKHHEGNYLNNQNPIMQAMTYEAKQNAFNHTLPEKGGSQKKKGSKASVKFEQDIALLMQAGDSMAITPRLEPAQFGVPPIAPKRIPSEYKPPDSFIQTMERPGPGRAGSSISGPSPIKANVLADLWTI